LLLLDIHRQPQKPRQPSCCASRCTCCAPAPQAIPAKIAIVQFEQAAAATNEGQRALQDLQKKYEPKKTQLDALGMEIDTLTKQLQAAPASMPDEEKARGNGRSRQAEAVPV